MKKIIYACLLTFNILPCYAQQQSDFSLLATQFIGYMEDGQYFDAHDMFELERRQLLSLDQLRDLWAQTIRQQGAFIDVEEVMVDNFGGAVIVRARTTFSSAPVVIQLTFNLNKKITDIIFNPVVTEASYVLPDYANSDLYRVEETFLKVVQGDLPAEFVRPTFIDKYPVVIMVHGSGPFDKDETVGPNKPFKDLAVGLATQGIATFRYDKKTRIYPQYFEAIRSKLTVEQEVLEDVAAAIDMVKKIKGVDRKQIYILGHSLGGMLSPRIVQQNNEVDGAIIMAGNARPLEDLIRYQIDYLNSLNRVPDNQKESQAAINEEIQLLKAKNKSIGMAPDDLRLDLPVEYWRDLSVYDQLSVAQEIKEPLLLLHGGRDYEVPIEDFERWKSQLADKENVFFILYPTLNHIFIPGEGRSSPMHYFNPGHVPGAVVMDIAKWIKSQK